MENNTPNTDNFLNWVEIKNFKSIKDLRLDCKRVNVFIGKPNVGKSNILEGLGLLGTGYDEGKFLKNAARYGQMKDFFYDKDLSNIVIIKTDKRATILGSSFELQRLDDKGEVTNRKTVFEIGTFEIDEYQQLIDSQTNLYFSLKASKEINESGDLSEVSLQESGKHNKLNEKLKLVKKYDFINLIHFRDSYRKFLLPPIGINLYEVLRRNRELLSEFANLFTEQNLELVLDDEKQEILLQKKDAPFVWQYPYFSIADTFRRFMFYITAIESNKNSVIVFEEPEVHSFPPYTQDVAYRMIYSEENQFFVSTHSPYLLQTLVANLNDDQLNVFVTYYEDYQTKVKALTPEELSFVQEYSTDVFFNLDRFVPNAQSANPA